MTRRKTRAVVRAVERTDAWTNETTGFGTDYDKTTATQFVPSAYLDGGQLDALYHSNDIAATIVNVIPEEMLRRGFHFHASVDADRTNDALQTAFAELDAVEKIIEADVWGRLYGGAALVIGADDGGSAAEPLIPERVRRVEWLQVVDRRYITPNTFYASGAQSGEPETYTLHRPGQYPGGSGASGAFTIHESRMLLFRGARTSQLQRQAQNYWDLSVLQRPYEIMRAFATAYNAVEILLTDGPQAVFGVKNLAQYIAGGGRAALEQRIATINLFRSVARAIAIDKDNESFERQTVSFAGIDTILDKFMLRLSAAVRIPVTILMGQSPAGMNATGESDFRWFYDTIETRQRNYMAPRLRRLAMVLCASREGPTGGKVPEGLKVRFENPYRPTALETAQLDKLKADTAVAYVGADILNPEEVALSPGFPDGFEIDREMRQPPRVPQPPRGTAIPAAGALVPGA